MRYIGDRAVYLGGVAARMLALSGGPGRSPHRAPATTLLKISVTGGSRKPPVVFSHRLHDTRGLACTQCHHEYQGRRNVWHGGMPVRPCQACLCLRPETRRLDVKNAFYRQCKGCHLQLKQLGRPGGPVECGGCHDVTGGFALRQEHGFDLHLQRIGLTFLAEICD